MFIILTLGNFYIVIIWKIALLLALIIVLGLIKLHNCVVLLTTRVNKFKSSPTYIGYLSF